MRDESVWANGPWGCWRQEPLQDGDRAWWVASSAVVQEIESLFDGGSIAGLTDRQLLERFTTRGDGVGEAAFAALVRRHGPMVLSICRQLLGDRHHAEDVFQAVFLVLARRARSIRDPELLGNWLYGVTLRTARKAKVRLVSRLKREDVDTMRHADVCADVPPVEMVVAQEQAEALHDEIRRLPVVFRLPVVLCYFEGLTVEEVAGQLQWPHGTVRSRLGGHATSSAAASPVVAWSCLSPLLLCSFRRRLVRRSHPHCARARLGPRFASRPEWPPQAPYRPRHLPLPTTCSAPCCSPS